MELDGYDISCSSVSEKEFVVFARRLAELLELSPGKSVLEIGCGAGALCKVMSDMGIEVAGVDYTPDLVEICRKALPQGQFFVGDGATFDVPQKGFDAVVSHSVFHYFPSDDYALEAYRRMMAHCRPGGIVALTDMHDARLREEHESRRKMMIGEEQYKRLYAELRHHYYDPGIFTRAAEAMGAKSWIEDQFLKSESAKFKFNFFSRKRSAETA